MRSSQGNSKTAAYSDEEDSHAFQWVVEWSQDFGLLYRAVWSMSQVLVAQEHGRRVAPAHLLQVVEASGTPVIIAPGGLGSTYGKRIKTWIWIERNTADDVPAVLYENSRVVLEELLQAALGTVHMQVSVDVVDVLNCGSEIRSLQPVRRYSLLLVVCFWFDTPLLQVVNQSIHWDTLSYS